MFKNKKIISRIKDYFYFNTVYTMLYLNTYLIEGRKIIFMKTYREIKNKLNFLIIKFISTVALVLTVDEKLKK